MYLSFSTIFANDLPCYTNVLDFQFDVELEPSCYFQTGLLVPDTNVLGRAMHGNLMALSLELGLTWLRDYR